MRIKKWHETSATPAKPWERDAVHYSEVPAVIYKLYAIRIKASTVKRWVKVGRRARCGQYEGQVVRLAHENRLGTLFVRIADLKLFCETT